MEDKDKQEEGKLYSSSTLIIHSTSIPWHLLCAHTTGYYWENKDKVIHSSLKFFKKEILHK